MQTGVIIEKGPVDWQIIQQADGYADIDLSGSIGLQSMEQAKERLNLPDTPKLTDIPGVFARVIKEDTGDRVILWQHCENIGSDRWSTTIKNVPAGGLYRIETCLKINDGFVLRGDMIHHVGVGDLYVITGQSNSAGYGQDPIYDPPEIGVHIYRNSGKWDLASHPLNDSTNTIHPENTEVANPGHSPHLSFAKILKGALGYPIGLLQASLGGSPLSAWNPEENGFLYRNMMNIIKSQGQTIKGVLWYQGCSDATDGLCDTYLERFNSMVSNLRKDLKNQKLPILTVQLNRYVASVNPIADRYWGKVREAQRQAAMQIPGVYVIPANDCTLSDAIHNSSSSNMVLGERLAKTAISKIYGKKTLCEAPNIIEAEKSGNDQVILKFEHVYDCLTTYEAAPDKLPFIVEDETGFIQINRYELKNKNTIVLFLNRELTRMCKVHGAFEQNPKPVVPMDNESHLPMLSFFGVRIENC